VKKYEGLSYSRTAKNTADVGRIISEEGAHGWEAVSVLPSQGLPEFLKALPDSFLFVFKREILEPTGSPSEDGPEPVFG